MTDNSGSAFPTRGYVDGNGNEHFHPSSGMTQRQYIAALMLQGILASGTTAIATAPQRAVKLADDLITELEKEPEQYAEQHRSGSPEDSGRPQPEPD